MSTDPRTIWKRRIVLMAIVGLAVAIPVTLLIGEKDEPAAPEAIVVPDPQLQATEYDRDLGLELKLPDGWTKKRSKDVLTLSSADKAARVAISAPGPAEDANQLHSEVIAGLRDTYKSVETLNKLPSTSIGDLKGKATALAVTTKGGDDMRILVSTAKGDKRAYLVVVFTRADDPGESTLEAQALLNEVKFVG